MRTCGDKILTKEAMVDERQRLRSAGKTVVFTNGCFDILHSGHIAYLEFARSEPERFRLMYSLDPGELPGLPSIRAARERAFAEARGLAADAVEAGWLRGDPNLAAHLLWVGGHGLASLSLSGQLDLGCTYDELVEPLLALLVPAS